MKSKPADLYKRLVKRYPDFKSLKGLRDIEVVAVDKGPPEVKLHGGAAKRLAALGGEKVLISLSHTKEYAVAHADII